LAFNLPDMRFRNCFFIFNLLIVHINVFANMTPCIAG